MTDNNTNSKTPKLGEAFQEAPSAEDRSKVVSGEAGGRVDGKTGKRRFFGLGKKKETDRGRTGEDTNEGATAPFSSDVPTIPAIRSHSPLKGASNIPVVTKTTSSPYTPTSPARNLQSSSPAPPSPASSQIFERHVQEDLPAISAETPIPGHIATENHIPPVLDASSEAITNEQLNPDQVEIVMHTAHQPASLTVTGAGSNETGGSTLLDDAHPIPENEDNVSNYGSLDSTDVRRLSFISFADVVHAEHSHDGASVTTGMISPVASNNRSPSPVRSPLSSQGLTGSPNLSGSVSSKGLETSPSRGPIGLISPPSGQSPPSGNELTVETMRQALRKTGSGDLKSSPMNATSENDHFLDQSLK